MDDENVKMSDSSTTTLWKHTKVAFKRECRRNHDARWSRGDSGLARDYAVCKMGCGCNYFYIIRNEYNLAYLVCKKCGNPSGLPLGVKQVMKKRKASYEVDK